MTAKIDVAHEVQGLRSAEGELFGPNGYTVANIVKLGLMFNRLRVRAKRTWLRHARELGYHPNVASRYMAVAGSWWAETQQPHDLGMVASLPPDLEKLFWLCRLDRNQLADCARDLSLRGCTLSEVVQAVKQKTQPPASSDGSFRGHGSDAPDAGDDNSDAAEATDEGSRAA